MRSQAFTVCVAFFLCIIQSTIGIASTTHRWAFQVNTNGPVSVARGEVVSYTIYVNNLGPSAVAGALITDLFPAGFENITWKASAYPGTVIIGNTSGTGNVSLQANLPVSNYSGVQISVTATVSQSATLGATQNLVQVGIPGNSPTSTAYAINVSAVAALAIVNTAPLTVTEGSTLSYKLEIVNGGPSFANGTVVIDTVPSVLVSPVFEVSSATAGVSNISFSNKGNALQANIGTFPAQAKVVLLLKGTTSGTGKVSNTAYVVAPTGTNNPDTASSQSTAITEVTHTTQ